MNKYIYSLILIAVSFSVVSAQGNGAGQEARDRGLLRDGQIEQGEMQGMANPIVGEQERDQMREQVQEQIGTTTRNWDSGNRSATGTPEAIQNRMESRKQNIGERRNRIQNMVEERKNQVTARREDMLQQREAVKVRLGDQRQERVRNLAGNIVQNFSKFTGRLNELQNRLSDLIAEQDEDDMTGAQSQLDQASDMLDQVMIKVESFSVDLEDALGGEVTKEYFIEITNEIKKEIIATHKNYQEVVSLINQN